MTGQGWQAARNVLCVRLDTIGDVLMMTPAMRALKESVDDRVITLMTSSRGSSVAPLIPEVGDVIVYDVPWMKATPEGATYAVDLAMCELLRRRRFDAAVIFTTYSQSPLPAALLLHLGNVPLRLAHCRENPYQLLTDWVAEPEPQTGIRHEVRRQLDLVAAIDAVNGDESLSLVVPERARAVVRRLLADNGIEDGDAYIVMHPGASAPSRRWEPEGFMDVARGLAEEGCHLVLTGDAGERGLAASIAAAAARRPLSLAGCLDLAELSALIEGAALLISNNTAPVHIACAMGTPVVDLYALTNPQHTPWNATSRVLSHDVPCKFCYRSICPEGHHECLRLVEPERVLAAAHSLLPASCRS